MASHLEDRDTETVKCCKHPTNCKALNKTMRTPTIFNLPRIMSFESLECSHNNFKTDLKILTDTKLPSSTTRTLTEENFHGPFLAEFFFSHKKMANIYAPTFVFLTVGQYIYLKDRISSLEGHSKRTALSCPNSKANRYCFYFLFLM